MKWFTCAALFAIGHCARAISGECPDLEVTGLVDFGKSPSACLRTGNESFTLHPGETAAGFILKQVDARAGWALFERGTNQFKVRLSNYCATSATLATSAPSFRVPRPYWRPMPPGTGAPVDPNTGLAPDTIAGGDAGAARVQVSANGWPTWLPGSSRASVPAQPNLPAPLPSDPTVPPQFSRPEGTTPPTGALDASSVAGVNQGDTQPPPDASADSPVDQPSQPKTRQEIRREEREKVKMYYGLEGFLAWDVAQGPL